MATATSRSLPPNDKSVPDVGVTTTFVANWSTVTDAVANLPSEKARILVVPLPTEVTIPDPPTVAIMGS